MKRILLAGYGNIAHAFEKIMNEQEQNGSFTLTICDLKEGQDIFDFLPRHHDEFDVVVNTSVANSIEIARMCIDYGLDCIDGRLYRGYEADIVLAYAQPYHVRLWHQSRHT